MKTASSGAVELRHLHHAHRGGETVNDEDVNADDGHRRAAARQKARVARSTWCVHSYLHFYTGMACAPAYKRAESTKGFNPIDSGAVASWRQTEKVPYTWRYDDLHFQHRPRPAR